MSDIKVAILGAGAMGKVLSQMAEEREGYETAGIVEPLNGETLEALHRKVGGAEEGGGAWGCQNGGAEEGGGAGGCQNGGAEEGKAFDVVIDFSHPSNLEMLCAYCKEHRCPAVIATTGLEERHTEMIRELAKTVPVVFSANYSLGVNIIKRVVAEITPVLEEAFDIEIVEMHHSKKLDAPSGTAKMLLAAADGEGKYDHVYGREGMRKRGKEIGIHTLRGGTVAGEHTVIYAGEDEMIEIKHRAGSKKIFAAGALKAAAFATEAEAGFYTMEDILFG